MTLAIRKLNRYFAAEVGGVDLAAPLDAARRAAIAAALDAHSVLVFRGQALDDAAQLAFSERLGALETTISRSPGGGRRRVAVLSNLDADGRLLPPGDARLVGDTYLGCADRAELPPVRHPLVRVSPATGEPALHIGAHASYVEGMPVAEGRALLAELLAHATRSAFVYRHRWRAGDAVM